MAILVCLLLTVCASATTLHEQFRNPPDEARIMMRWWWFGPAVSKRQLEREMRTMREGGIGGFEVQPVYPLQLEGNMKFLSPDFLDALRFTADKARELGMRFDLTLGSGWPFGGPQIPIAQAAGRLRVAKSPALRDGESLVVDAGGTYFIASRTRQMVKRASLGAEGYVLDHYDRSATDRYLRDPGETLLKPLAGAAPQAIFCDSLEAFGSDWTASLPEEFRKRRGYDLKPWLPVLASGSGPEAAGVRHDWGLTLTELLEDNFLKPVQSWAHAKGTKFRIQGYGIPPAVVSSNAWADISEGEGSQWKVVRASRWASSANHLYGRPVTTSETWTWLHSPVFRASPLDIKAEADIHFLQGVNQLIGHGWPYSPETAEYPGWRFYASAVFNDRNPWWIVMPDVTRYLQRISFLMRQGKPANDIALYMPNSDAWSHFSPGRVHMIEALREHVGTEIMAQILDSGYGLDFVDDRTMDLATDGRYKAVVLPRVEYVPVETMRRLEAFAKKGGIVVAAGRLPAKAPGLKAAKQDTDEIGAIAGRLFRHAIPDAELGAALRESLTPDMQLSTPMPEIGFVHRSTPDAEIYFIANTANTRKTVQAAFRVKGRQAEWWNAFTGEVRPAGGSTVLLDLAPFESRVLVFRPGAARAAAAERRVGPAIDLSRGWTVRVGDQTMQWDTLRSWTEDPKTRFYSGTATYEKNVTVQTKKGEQVRLDFGEGAPLPVPPADPRRPSGPGMRAWFDPPVRESAVVYVNGRRAGSLWSPPYQLDVTEYLKNGENAIRVVVANLALNRMAAKPLPDYRDLRAKFGNRFDPQDMDQVQPIPSGLLGPVRLVSYR